MTVREEYLGYLKIRAVLEEKNPNIYVEDFVASAVEGYTILWVMVLKTFNKNHLLYWLQEVSNYYNLNLIIFRIERSSHLVYIHKFNAVYKIVDDVIDLSYADLQKQRLSIDELRRILNARFAINNKRKKKGKE